MQPLRDRMFVLPARERDNITAAGIIIGARKGIHESQTQLGLECLVMAVGPEVDQDQVKPGDTVLIGEFEFPKYGDYLVIQDADIVGVVQ